MLEMIRMPYGMVFVSGPTGSGKSTTLYAALNAINDPGKQVITVEDPIEFTMDGITQVAVNNRVGLTFASGLRTILRSDPDVVMIGEVRDPDTAEIAVRAALTGHLVLSSIHTNDAPSALTRLNDMGIPPYITSSALLGVIAQRLIRTLCTECKAPVEVPRERLLAAGYSDEEIETIRLHGPVGCDHCNTTGYRGRLGVFEVMRMSSALQALFLRNAPAEQLREVALSEGMRPLRRDALDKAALGITSLEEVDRVVI
jgi:type IV pilus assembly protein PilB